MRIPRSTCFHIPDGATLLLVEDDASVRRSLRRLLDPHRTTLVEAADGEHAIRLIEQDEAQLLDVVLTDLKMPVVSGSELIAILLECRPALPVVAMSGSIDFHPTSFRCLCCGSRSSQSCWYERSRRWSLSRKQCVGGHGSRARMPPNRAHRPSDSGRSQRTRGPTAATSWSPWWSFAAAWRFRDRCGPPPPRP